MRRVAMVLALALAGAGWADEALFAQRALDAARPQAQRLEESITKGAAARKGAKDRASCIEALASIRGIPDQTIEALTRMRAPTYGHGDLVEAALQMKACLSCGDSVPDPECSKAKSALDRWRARFDPPKPQSPILTLVSEDYTGRPGCDRWRVEIKASSKLTEAAARSAVEAEVSKTRARHPAARAIQVVLTGWSASSKIRVGEEDAWTYTMLTANWSITGSWGTACKDAPEAPGIEWHSVEQVSKTKQ